MQRYVIAKTTKTIQSTVMVFLIVMSLFPLAALDVAAGTISVDATLQKEQSKIVQLGIKDYTLRLKKVLDSQTVQLDIGGEEITAALGEHVLLEDGTEAVVTEISQEGATETVELSLSAQDGQAPVLHGITTDADSVNAGQTMNVIMTVVDDFTGVSYVALDAKSPSGGQTLHAGGGVQHSSENTYTFPIAIPTNAEDGMWSISQVLVMDAVANQDYLYSPNDFTQTFRVVSEQSDTEKPELVSIAVTEEVTYGEVVTLTVVAVDDLSGVTTLRATAKSPTGKQSEQFMQWQLVGENTWQSSIVIKDYAEQGYWKITQLDIEDNAHNKATFYYGNSYDAGFTVKSTNNRADTQAPQFSEIKLSPKQLRYGNTVTLSVTLTDDLSGIDEGSLFAMLESFTNGQYQYSQQWSHDPGTNTYTTSFTVPKFSEIGPWHLGRLVVRDKAGNELYEWFDKDDYWVYVTGYDDVQKPDLFVKSLELSPSQAKSNEDVTMKVTVRNDYAPVVRATWKAVADDLGDKGRIGAGTASKDQEGVLENLAVGEERTLTLLFRYTAGGPSASTTYTPSFTVDSDNAIAELDESNNKRFGYVKVSGTSPSQDAVEVPRTTTDPRDFFEDYYGIEDFYIRSETWVGNVHWNDPNRAYTEKIGNNVIAHFEDASPTLNQETEDLRFTAYTSGNKIFVEKWVGEKVAYRDETHLVLDYDTPKKVTLEDTGQTYTGTRIDLVLWNDVHDRDATRTITIQESQTASSSRGSGGGYAGTRTESADAQPVVDTRAFGSRSPVASAVVVPTPVTSLPKTIDVNLGEEFVLSVGQTAHVVDYRDMRIKLNSVSGGGTTCAAIGCPELGLIASMDATARLEQNYFTLPSLELKQGKQRGVFGAQLSAISLSSERGLFKLTKGNDQFSSDVDVGIEPRSIEVNAGEKAYYDIVVEDNHYLGTGVDNIGYWMQEFNYTIGVVGLPFAKEFPSTITLRSGETKRITLVVDTSQKVTVGKEIIGRADTIPKTTKLSLREGYTKTIEIGDEFFYLTVNVFDSGSGAYFSVNSELSPELNLGDVWSFGNNNLLTVDNIYYNEPKSKDTVWITITSSTEIEYDQVEEPSDQSVTTSDSSSAAIPDQSSAGSSSGGGAGAAPTMDSQGSDTAERQPGEEGSGRGGAGGGGGGGAGPRIIHDIGAQDETEDEVVTATTSPSGSSSASLGAVIEEVQEARYEGTVYETVALSGASSGTSSAVSTATSAKPLTTESVAIPESVVVYPISAQEVSPISVDESVGETFAMQDEPRAESGAESGFDAREGDTYHFIVVVTNGPESDVAYGTLTIVNQSIVEKRNTQQIQLSEGWNLVSVPNRLISFDASNCSENKKPLAFVYNDEEQEYLSLRDAQKKLGSMFLKYVSERAVWMYSYTPCTLDVALGKETSYSDLRLSQGWNLLPVTQDMVGQRFIDLGNNCQYTKLYRWNTLEQQWESTDLFTLITEADLMHGFLVKTASSCEWGEYTLLPPPMPIEEESTSDISTSDVRG